MKLQKNNSKTVLDNANINLLKIDFKSKYLRLLHSLKLLKHEKQELQQAFEEIEDIYSHAPCGYHSIDQHGIFVRINDTELKWLGYTEPGFTGVKKFTDILSEASRIKFNKTFPVFMKTGEIHEVEFEFVRKDGTVFPVVVSATAIYDEAGNFCMSRSVVQDVSSRKSMEEKLHHSYKTLQEKNDALVSANKDLHTLSNEKNHFLDIASHDLQLPLAAISMLSETLLRDNLVPGSAEQVQVFEMIHDACLEMKSLLSNYLSASVSATGKMDLLITEFDINVLTNDIVTRYIAIAKKKKIQLHFENKKNYLVFSDRECCSQVIENILSNAVKYTTPGKNVYIEIAGNDLGVNIIIADEGPGIREEDRHLLFQRFQRLSARPTGGELSTGLGLSIVKYLVERLRGAVTVESTVGKGSVFTVHLPANTSL